MRLLLFVGALLILCVAPSFADWGYYGEFEMPASFGSDTQLQFPMLLQTGGGGFGGPARLFVATLEGADSQVIRIDDPLSPSRTLTTIYTRSCEAGRGIVGLAYDSMGDTLYVSGDAGDTNKFVDRVTFASYPTPTVESDWLIPSYRVGGCALTWFGYVGPEAYLYLGDYVGGTVHCYRISDKAEMTPAASMSGTYARDLVIAPYSVGGATYDIFMQRNGNLQRITGGDPSDMGSYGTGTDVITCPDETIMQFKSGCCIGFSSGVMPLQVVYNSVATATSPAGDAVYVCNLDDPNFQNDETLPIGDSPVRDYWEMALDATGMTIDMIPYLFVADAADIETVEDPETHTSRIVIFGLAAPPTPTPPAGAIGWQWYE